MLRYVRQRMGQEWAAYSFNYPLVQKKKWWDLFAEKDLLTLWERSDKEFFFLFYVKDLLTIRKNSWKTANSTSRGSTSKAWCKSGTRTPGPSDWGPSTPLKFKIGTPGSSSRFNSGTLGPTPIKSLKVEPPHLSLMNSCFSEYFFAFFTYLFFVFFK